jgi:pyruvate/2-oxoglutarate dehydrogenase complex dihydrolipoamide dehydrogenase (E3) component
VTDLIDADLCVIGGGAAGLSVAAGAAQMGARTVLIERGRMGGDCLNTGCVPSKALLAAAHRAAAAAEAAAFGVILPPPTIDGQAVFAHVRAVIAGIAPHDSVERFTGLGVSVIAADARFTGRTEVTAGSIHVRARRVVVATGGQPDTGGVPGLAATPYLTNETVFGLDAMPDHLIVIGGGPIGVEMAQAFARLGARVSLVQRRTILPREDPALVAVVRARLVADGVRLIENATVRRVEEIRGGDTATDAAGGGPAPGVAVTVATATGEQRLAGSHLLVAIGRRPTVDGLALEEAGIACLADGIPVDTRLRTSNRRVFAIGDVVAGWPRHTHVAAYQAGIVLRNALFRLPTRADRRVLPRVTYADPELAQVGLTEAEAAAAGHRARVVEAAFAGNDRARAERRSEGRIRVVVGRLGRILGCGIAGPAAGELIQPWVLAMEQRLRIGAMARTVAPYPTLGEISKRVAGTYFQPSLFGPRTRWLVRQLARLDRG